MTEDPVYVGADYVYWGSVYHDIKTILRFLSTFVPYGPQVLSALSMAELMYVVFSGHGIQPSDPNYNAPVGNSPAQI